MVQRALSDPAAARRLTPRAACCRALLLALTALLPVTALHAADPRPLATPDPATIPWPGGVPASDAEILLGKTLFFDPRLSRNRTQSCASCHNPALGLGDGVALGTGAEGNRLGRNTPPLYNLAWNTAFFWDGRAPSLEAQALNPIESNAEMNIPLPMLVERLSGIEGYRPLFRDAFGDDTVDAARIGRALAAFERTLVSRNSPFDRFLAGDTNAMSEAAQRGLKLFRGAAWCSVCHDGPNLTDSAFHNIGVRGNDPGRQAIAPGHRMQGAFKTPGLRNVALTAPYMHDGSVATLEDVMKFYNRGGDDHRRRDPLVRELDLSKRDIADLVEFMKALTDPLPIEPPVLPD